MLSYPTEFLRSTDEKYDINDVIKMNVPIAVVGLFDSGIRVKLVINEFLEFGNIFPHIKVAPVDVISKYIDARIVKSLPLEIIICALPMSGPEAFELADMCVQHMNVPEMIERLISGLNAIAANDRTIAMALSKILQVIKRNKTFTTKIKHVAIRSLISRKYTRYGEKLDDAQDGKKKTKSVKLDKIVVDT